jgi:dGTP triphosphohydrolase
MKLCWIAPSKNKVLDPINLPIEFRKEFEKSNLKAEDVILDYIASLSDTEAIKLLKKLNKYPYFKYKK